VTSLSLRAASPAKTRADAVVVGLVQSRNTVEVAPGGEDVAAAYGRRLRPLLATFAAKGTPGEIVRIPTNGVLNSPLLVLVGLGRKSDLTPAVVRRAAGVAARAVPNASSVALALPAADEAGVRAVAEGWLLGGYRFTDYKSEKGDEPAGTVVVLTPGARQEAMTDALARAQVVAEAVAGTRDWVNQPAGRLRPPDFAKAVEDAVKATRKALPKEGPKLAVRVLDEEQLAELGCGGILGVGLGSGAPPRLVEITSTPADPVAHLALVGKGITFDSGGLTLKPANSMTAMKSDMAGAAAVVQATLAIARLGLPVTVSCFAPMAENMVSGTSMRPGDVLTMADGTTVEVLNTDAEGRLVLGDALVRAAATGPDVIVDVATLTGHMSIALGDRVGAVFGSDDVVGAVVAAGEEAGEKHWPMPITDEVVDRMKASAVADLLQHDWIRWGGGLYAAGFLREFTAGLPWAHLDIAGPAFHTGAAYGHVPAGGTGFATATLVDYARSLVHSDSSAG
jgi:leucyl aminopeptidase